MADQIKKLKDKYNKVRLQREDYAKKHSIHNLKSEYIGCKKCGSKLKLSLVPKENCPLCYNDLRNKSVLQKLKDYSILMMQIQDEINFEKEPELKKGIKTSFSIYKYEKDKYDEVLLKVLIHLENVYGEEFRSAECAKNDDYILVVTTDYNHAKTYFSAWYDCYIFDKEGNFVLSRKRFIEGSAYNDFYVDRADFADNKFRIFMRSHMKPYSKCDDEYLAIWTINTDCKSFIHIQKNPFIFKERSAERYYSVYYDHFSNINGEYYQFEEEGMEYTAYELSIDKNKRDKIIAKYKED